MSSDNILAGLEGFFSGFERGYVPFMQKKYKSDLEAQLKQKESDIGFEDFKRKLPLEEGSKIRIEQAKPSTGGDIGLSPSAQDYWSNYVAQTGGLPSNLGMGMPGLRKNLLEGGAQKGIAQGLNPATQNQKYKSETQARNAASSSSARVQDAKVNQAKDLVSLLDQNYDPKTKEYTIPPAQHAELALGLARLLSPTGQVAVELEQQLRQQTGRESLANMLIYAGADPKDVGGTTQSVTRYLAHTIGRQGKLAQQLRDQYAPGIGSQFAEPSSLKDMDKENGLFGVGKKSPNSGKTKSGMSYTVER